MTNDDLKLLVDAQALDECLWFNAQTAPEAYLQEALRKLHSAIESVDDDWISVADRLPITEKDMGTCKYKTVDVNILTESGNVFPAEFEAGNTVEFWGKFKGFYTSSLSAWQPLPSPPNQPKG